MKTKLTLSVLFFSIYIFQVQAQEWAPIGATWSYTMVSWWQPWNQRVVSIKSVKDSLHNGQMVRVLKTDVRFDCYGIVDEEVLSYEKDGKILFKLGTDQEFDTLYDFSATIGDHWRFTVDCYEPDRFVEFRVVEIDSIWINSENRKLFHYAVIDSLNPCTELLRDTIEVIEGIGYTEYLLPFWGTVCDGDYLKNFRCYADSNLGTYIHDPNVRDCDEITEYNDWNWAPLGATWYYRKDWPTEVFTIEVVGDSILNGSWVRHLEVRDGLGCSPTGFNMFTYSDNGNILVKINGNHVFDTLFDFNANINDSWSFTIDTSCLEESTVKFTVVDTASLEINGQIRRVQYCTAKIEEIPCIEFWGDTVEVIEGIGNTLYLFPFYAPLCDEDFVSGLRCYEDPTLGLYKHDPSIDQCDVITNTTEVNPLQVFQIYPNPTTNVLNVITPKVGKYQYELIDIQGQLIEKGLLSKPEIDVGNLTSGVYLLRLKTKEWTFVQQFVKT